MKIIIAILLLGIIIFIHELGHFLLAKKNGITVTEFSLGMGPRIASYTKNGTRYSLKILPIGGSCMMLGEDEDIDDEGAFHKKGVGARFSVIFAGAFFNFILAFVLAVVVIGAVGVDYPEVTELSDESPVYEAGIREGDIIKKINGKTIHFGKDINLYFFFNPVSDAPIDITYQSDGVEKKARITPRLVENSYDLGRFYNIYREKVTPLETVKNSFYEVKYNINYTMQSIKYLVTGRVNINEISGPVGIVSIVGGIIDESESEGAGFAFLNLANFALLLSANLGVMNLLPFPALDGGRLVFLVIEAIRRKPVPKDKEAMVHFVGLALLMILMVVVLYNDIRKIF